MRKLKDKKKEAAKRKAIMASVKGYTKPDFDKLQKDHPEYSSELVYAFNYANYMFDFKDLKRFSEEFYGETISKVPDWEFFFIGQVAWIINNGAYYPEFKIQELKDRISALVEKYKPEVVVVLPQKDTQTGDLIAELEGILDDVVLRKSDITQPLSRIQDFPKASLAKVKEHFTKIFESVPEEEFLGQDKKLLSAALKVVLNDIAKAMQEAPKKARKARIKKAKKIVPAKMVRKLKFLRADKESGLTSIDPEKIVGAQSLWVYNTKTRKLGRYVAKDETGLLVKGSTILNFNEEESVSKKLRKPEVVLKTLESAGKVEQRKLLGTIKSVENKLNGRVNDKTILVKV